jgi:AraC-like DNA-binding protein
MLRTFIVDVTRESQVFAGRSILADSTSSRELLVSDFVSRLPRPAGVCDSVVLRSVLFDVALGWAHQVHRLHHDDDYEECPFDPVSDVIAFWQRRQLSPISTFAEWANSFLNAFDRAHPVSVASRVKDLIDRQADASESVQRLARMAGCHPARLRVLFKRTFGTSMREYRTRRQTLHAARLLATSDYKVDAIARLSGFGSRKNFYAAFQRIVGKTPSSVRTWSLCEIEGLERRWATKQ